MEPPQAGAQSQRQSQQGEELPGPAQQELPAAAAATAGAAIPEAAPAGGAGPVGAAGNPGGSRTAGPGPTSASSSVPMPAAPMPAAALAPAAVALAGMFPQVAASAGSSQQQQVAGGQPGASPGLAWPGVAGAALPAVVAEAAAVAAAAAAAAPQPHAAAGTAPPAPAVPPKKKPGRQRRTSILCQVGRGGRRRDRLVLRPRDGRGGGGRTAGERAHPPLAAGCAALLTPGAPCRAPAGTGAWLRRRARE